jgi:nucleotide-binding universal stress UspA family protein
MATIVVGEDGSDDRHSALRFAIEEAQLRGWRLRVICAWELPVAEWGELPPPDETLDRFRREAEEIVATATEIVETEAPGVEVEGLALEGPPARVLLDGCSEASLLVVGSRGRGAVTGLILGSVSQDVAQHAACTVVLVPLQGSSS